MAQAPLVGLLGSLTVDHGAARSAGLPSATQRRLLSVLAVEAGHVVSATRLCELLGCSNGALRTTVSRLRATVGPEHLATEPPGYVLTAVTDLAEFERSVADGLAATGTASIEVLERALALWRGEPLEEFREEYWAVAVVDRLHELRATAVELRAEAMLSERRSDLVIAEMRSHIARHPLRERPRMILMRALDDDGRATEALRVYQDFRHELVDLAGTEPSAAMRELERAISLGTVHGAGPAGEHAVDVLRRSNLPAQRTTLIGREQLVERVGELLGEHRLVSLLGPGGVGKTRLAIEAAGRAWGDTTGDVVFVDLTDAGEDLDVPGVVLRSLRVPVRPEQTDADAIAEHLAGRRTLLVVDNCEHVIERAAEVIDGLLVAADGARVLATSREPLRLHGERRLIVPSLDVEGPDSSAARLFLDRAAALDEARSTGRPDADRDAVGEIVRRLDGIPLAIELAAARTETLSAPEILDLLDDRFAVLAEHLRGVPARQQTLAATVQWSYDLLSAEQQAAFRSLAACGGAVSVTTAARLLGLPHDHAERLLGELRAKSLVVAVPQRDRPIGFTLLETLREFGRAVAAEAGETRSAQRAVEVALLPPGELREDWTALVNGYICGADPAVMNEAATRLAAAASAQEHGRLDDAAYLFASVAFRDEIGALRARTSTVHQLTQRRSDLSPMAWRVANAASLLFERSGRDYGAVLTTAATMTAALPDDDPARSWFELWTCALTTAVDPEGGLVAIDAALPSARRRARAPLDWTLSQYLGIQATGLAMTRRIDDARPVAAEAARWAPVGQESRDQILALRAWLDHLGRAPVDHRLLADIDAQDIDAGLAELCAAPGILCRGGSIRSRAGLLVAAARRRPRFDIPTPYLIAFAWLALEAGETAHAGRLVTHAELYDASTQLALVHLLAEVEQWGPDGWTAGRDTTVARYLSPEHELAVEQGGTDLEVELRRWELVLADGAAGPHAP